MDEVARPPTSLRGLLPFLAAYVAFLAGYAALAQGWGPLHSDITEMWAWGKEFQLGYNKHPPFAAWLAGGWFAFMPRAHWAFYLLAALNGAAGLAGVWAVSRLVVDRPGAWAAVLALALTPSFTLSALKYNANAPLLSLWPWATYFFVRSLQTRTAWSSAAAGLAAAAALLTKYYSVVLLGTFLCVALLHPDRRRYFLSVAPYVAAAVGLVAIGPHLWWLYADGFSAIEYAASKASYGAGEALRDTADGALRAVASVGLAVAAFAVVFGGQFPVMLGRALAGCREPGIAWVACLAAGPFLLSMAAYAFGNVRVIASYLLPVFFALPLAFLAAARTDVSVLHVRRLAVIVAAVWAMVLLAAPVIGVISWHTSRAGWLEPRQEVAAYATELWHARFGRRLRFVSGSEDVAKAVTFYSADAPSYLLLASFFGSQRRMSADEARRLEGVLFICRNLDPWCIDMVARLVGGDAVRLEQSFTPTFLGFTRPAHHFTLFAQPPRSVPR
ncbi:MAG TPA: glycosyltransferase family 39 protein [Hyphomicrobiaceae bacterium]|nr:glycosyltransferase family 39 protein [Hyphomicrobiaceae bacterium]